MSNYYLEVDGIPGECTDGNHKGWILVESFSHGLSQPHATASTGGGARGGISKVEHGDFTVVKQLDKASPKLFLQCCNGKRIPTVTIELVRQVDDKMTYQKYVFTGALVRSVSTSLSEGGERPEEEVAFAYEKMEMTYTEVDPRTNKANGDTMMVWDALQNVGG